jgi:hypothetical protein
LRNPIVCSGLLLKQTQAYIYIRLIASGIDKIHNCPKCLKEKHFQKFRWHPQFTTNGLSYADVIDVVKFDMSSH